MGQVLYFPCVQIGDEHAFRENDVDAFGTMPTPHKRGRESNLGSFPEGRGSRNCDLSAVCAPFVREANHE
jgi:hypothetical protein